MSFAAKRGKRRRRAKKIKFRGWTGTCEVQCEPGPLQGLLASCAVEAILEPD